MAVQTLGGMPRGRRLVVQLQETFREKMEPGFVEFLEAWGLKERAGMALPPVMIYGDDLTHIVTEEGIAYLHKCRSLEERQAAIRAIAGFTRVGLKADPSQTRDLRARGIVKTPEDLGIDPTRATRKLLAAQNVHDLVKWSGGLYQPPGKYKNW